MTLQQSEYRPISQLGVGCANVTDLEKKYVMEAMDNQRLSYGPFSRKFEEKFSRRHNTKYGIFCNSGTSALHIALACLKESENWQDGDEVIVPALTFVATANIVIENNFKPVFVDVDPLTYNINPDLIKKALTPKTRAIIPVHLFGLPADMDPIMKIAASHKLKMIEDSCETMCVTYKGKSVGSFGDIACFSTYVAHLIVTGVGGLAITNNSDYAVTMKSLMNHGRDSIYLSIDDDKKGDQAQRNMIVDRRFRFVRVGYSYRATELEAAMGVAQLERIDSILKTRQSNATYLIKKLTPLSEVLQLPTIPEGRDHAFMMFPLVLKNKNGNKKELVHFLEENLIETRDMLPLTNQPVYEKRFGPIEDHYPVAQHINNNGFYIGCHQGLTQKDLDYIIGRFYEFFEKRK